jgi:NAD(P)-dependent dehydrogenase (short-subunit alcohol dehydrogenase family)
VKTVIVTGASTGIGRATATEFAKNGFNVLLVARNEEKLNKVKEEIVALEEKAEVFIADLSSSDGVEKLVEVIKSKHSEINILCNIAGIWHGETEVYAGKDLESFQTKTIVDTLNVGTLAPMLLAHELVSLMPAGSSIINLSGTFENGGKGWIPYFVSKRAIEDLTVGLSQELNKKHINVNCISPSDTATEEYKRFFPEDVAGAQTPEQVATFFVDLSNKDVTGKIFVIKNGQSSEGFHM